MLLLFSTVHVGLNVRPQNASSCIKNRSPGGPWFPKEPAKPRPGWILLSVRLGSDFWTGLFWKWEGSWLRPSVELAVLPLAKQTAGSVWLWAEISEFRVIFQMGNGVGVTGQEPLFLILYLCSKVWLVWETSWQKPDQVTVYCLWVMCSSIPQQNEPKKQASWLSKALEKQPGILQNLGIQET